MNIRIVMITAAGVLLAGSGLFLQPQSWLVWNRTSSAPQGLYRLSGAPFTPGQWVAVSSRSKAGAWAEANGFVGRDWPLLKRIVAVQGAEICRIGADIFIDGVWAATALEADSRGRELPVWRGCHVLDKDEIFLLNAHPRSLDGRYFGATSIEDVDGVAIPLLLIGG
ncbi:S26 family signal peptidase [Henriciella sp.]|uniref:S26 family signal peptidase n=1 Tax=Henriciella sp. TaxID=1968823 RepID=UPI0026359514|nr:S26 family signal peptidase [Henriciella sp.]